MSTIQQIIDIVREIVGDKQEGGVSQFGDSRYLMALNNFGADIVALGKNKTIATDIVITPTTNKYAYPTGYWFPVSARYKDTNDYIPIDFLKSANVHTSDIVSSNTSGSPCYLFLIDDKIGVYPWPDNTYYLSIEMVKRFTKITVLDLSKNFETYIDTDYELYAIDYMVMNIMKPNDSLARETRSRFYSYDGAWRKITRLEDMKYIPFNAKNRRTSGVQNINNSDYDSLS